jgi:hypothetical protein
VTTGDRDKGEPTYIRDKEKGDTVKGLAMPPKLMGTSTFEFM